MSAREMSTAIKTSPGDRIPQRRRRRAATAAADMAIFATSAQANVVVVQPPDIPVHSPPDPVQPLSASRQQPPIEYYPPPPDHDHNAITPNIKTLSNTKPHITKKKNKRKEKAPHEPHSPWHTAEYLPQRLGMPQQQQQPEAGTSMKQVILRPRFSSSKTHSDKTIYYYDPSSLLSSVESPTLTLPEVIYDANGTPKTLSEVHKEDTEVFLEVKPRAVWGEKWQTKFNQKIQKVANINTMSSDQTSDQLIVFGTIATMAVMVGALSARRLKHKRLLEHCLESDLEDWEEDKKVDAPRYNSMQREYREGPLRKDFGLHWRGDLEKFDV